MLLVMIRVAAAPLSLALLCIRISLASRRSMDVTSRARILSTIVCLALSANRCQAMPYGPKVLCQKQLEGLIFGQALPFWQKPPP